jgi:hypothetical protein
MARNSSIKAWIGYQANVVIRPTDPTVAPAFRVRATNVGLQCKQEIEYPDLIDGVDDKTAYRLLGKNVEGPISFPLLHEGAGIGGLNTGKAGSSVCGNNITTSLASALWKMAALRDTDGRLKHTFDVDVAYPDNSKFRYPGCLVNTFGFKVTQGGSVECNADIIGGANANRETRSVISTFDYTPKFLTPARIVGWQDFVVALYSVNGGSRLGGTAIDGEGLREFSCDLKNNVDRYNTFNGTLTPQDITGKKREVSGMIKILGRNQYLNRMGDENEQFYSSDENIAFGYRIGANGGIYWSTALHGVIFKYEEMTISPGEVFETQVMYNALGDCSFNYEAIEKGSDTSVQSLPTTATTTNYGGSVRDSFTRSALGAWTVLG